MEIPISLRERIRLNLISAMDQANINQVQLAEKLGISKGTVNNWIRGNNSPDVDTVPKICKVLNISIITLYSPTKYEVPEYVDGEKNAPPYSDEAIQLAKDYDSLDEHGQRVVRVVTDEEIHRMELDKSKRRAEQYDVRMEAAEAIEPDTERVIDLLFDELKASAGSGYELDDDRMQVWKVVYNDLTRKADFCVEVDGRSMEPKIHSGDIILVRQQPAVDIGEIGLFTVNNKGYVKKQGPDRLISINPEEDDVFPGEYDTVLCRGKVLGLLDPEWIIDR